MWALRFRRFTKKQKRTTQPIMETPYKLPEKPANISTGIVQDVKNNIEINYTYFSTHIQKYIGETVTIFVIAGGLPGCGFTGILLDVNSSFVKLITRIGPPPIFLLGNPYIPYYNLVYPNHYQMGFINTLGSNTVIPINKIASFVHNTI